MMVSISTYAQQPKWSLHNSKVDYITGINGNLPASVSPDHIQNALWDDNGNLQFYVADGDIFNKNGSSMLLQPPTTDQGYWIDRCNYDKSELGYAEVALVPVPQTCNEFYVIFTTLGWDNSILPQDLSYYDDSGKFFLIYFRVDMDLNNGNGAIVPYPNPNQTNEHWCQGHNIIELPYSTSRTNSPILGDESYWNIYTQLLLGVAPENDQHKRFLFITTLEDLSVLEINNSGIDLLKVEESVSRRSLRGELEIFTTGDEYIVTYPYVNTTGTQDSPNDPTLSSGVDFLHFNKQDLTLNDQYYYDFHSLVEQEFFPVVKGLEFSESGNFLYCTVLNLDLGFIDGSTNGIPVTNVRQSTIHNFPFDNVNTNRYVFDYNPTIIYEETGDLNIGFGMIERGDDNKLYIAGENSLSTIDNSNNPLSTFTYGALTYPNQMTVRNINFPSNELSYYLEATYLLVDQQDQEENISSKHDQWPDVVNSFCSDQSILQSNFPGDWVWIPNATETLVFTDPCDPNSNINNPSGRPGEGDPIMYGNTNEVTLNGDGMLYFFYGSGECCFYETIRIDPWGDPSPQLNWVFINNGNSVDLTVSSTTHPLIIGYNWTLEEYDPASNSWTVINTINNHGATWNVSGLNILTDYRISLITIDDLQNTSCIYAIPQPIEINTGGRIGIFKGIADNQEVNNL